jgi:DNA replication and repair protein RecF
LKFAELSYIEKKTGEKPTLLLDDIFSELDHEHREVVMNAVGNQQTIITTADPHFIEDLKNVEKIKLD